MSLEAWGDENPMGDYDGYTHERVVELIQEAYRAGLIEARSAIAQMVFLYGDPGFARSIEASWRSKWGPTPWPLPEFDSLVKESIDDLNPAPPTEAKPDA